MIDLHVHSTFSDGSFTPEELVDKAIAGHVKAVALTDHDCTDGVGRFMKACADKGLIGIPGVEISAEVKEGTLHMLGYFLDLENQKLQDSLANIRGGREDRNQKILTKLNELGLELTWEEVASFAGEDVVGRPHFAQALLARGYVNSKKEVFDKYLARGKPGYIDRYRLPPEESIALIRQAGGVPVLAHPFTLDLGKNALAEYIEELADLGLQGIEAYYSEYSKDQQDWYIEVAKKCNLALAGGTDFHGEVNPKVRLGIGFGSLNVPDDLLVELERRRG